MKTMLRMLMLAAAVFVVSPAAYAAPAGGGACKADVQSFCSGVQKGGGAIARCLKEHKASLSEGCKAAIKERHAAHKGKRSGAVGTEPAAAPEGGSASEMPADAPVAE